MRLSLLQNALILSVASALALTGCPSDDDDEVTDAGPKDMGTTGGMDATTGQDAEVDAGTPDMGPRPDAGPGVCDEGLLGCPCTPGGEMNPAGNCMNPDHICATWSDMGQPLVATCVAPCDAEANGDTECAAEIVAGDPTRPASICRSGLCVEEEAEDGERCVRAAAAGETMAGCLPNSLCIGGVGAGPDYSGSCGLPCAGNGDCGGERPFCNPMILNSTVTPGICSDLRRGVGATCRTDDITGWCDTTAQFADGGFKIYCIDFLTDEGLGQCFELCDSTDPEASHCIAQTDPNVSPVCRTGLFVNPDIGACSDECTAFPNSCTSTGTLGLGQNCSQVSFGDFGDYAWCLDVNPPVLQEWDFDPNNLDSCGEANNDQFRCPLGTSCFGLSQTSNDAACIRGCNFFAADTATSGCQLSTVTATICEDLGNPALPGAGICIP